ncbi:MAG: hypothetical protein JRG91_00505, partial [Deltaproteobacteria bacterium]|nr:hypothetical protein [Deltaproteobacteria bacterium]
GDAKVDSFFGAVIALDASTGIVSSKVEDAIADLRVTLGLPADASLADIRAAIDDAFSTGGVTFNASYEPAECRADVDVAVQAAAECDVTVDPGEVDIRCEGRCEGTCQGGCTGECRLPSVEAYCEGTCHGECSIESTTECYGTCYGTCSGTCSYEVSGECQGSCSGTCTGRCETRIEGSCTGECHGECGVIVDSGECNAQCEATCEGHCEGSCEGTVRPPSMDADCEAQFEARVEASVECDPPRIDFGVDTSGIDNILEISHHLGRILAATAEADAILAGVDGFSASFTPAMQAMINGELPANKTACALLQMDEAFAILGEAAVTLNAVVVIDATLIL